jgi:hypothetical protein
MTQTHRWDYHTAPLIRVGFWSLLLLAGLGLNWAATSEVKVYTGGKGTLEQTQGQLRFGFAIPNSDAAKVRLGMPVTIAWTDFPRTQYGTSQATLQQLNLDGPSPQVIAVLKNPLLKSTHHSQTLYAGLSGKAQILLEQRKALELLWAWLKGR